MRALRAFIFVLLLCLPAAASAQSVPSSRFGIVEGFWLPELTCSLHVGWERIIFDWSQHQPNGPSDWHTLNVDDRWLKAASRCGREVVALLKNTPQWATDGRAGIGVPRGLHLPIDHPDNLWAGFVRRTADYYASRGVNRFIIWNEPDIQADAYGYEFEGTVDDYFMLLKVAYLAARAANPSAKIHLAGTTYWHDVNQGRTPYIERLLDRIAQDPAAAAHGHYFDVLSLHIYFRSETVPLIVQEMRGLLDARGLSDKAIWINETNAAPTADPDWLVQRPAFQLDLKQQAAYIVQAAALALASGVERMAVYKLFDQQLPAGGESFGILNPASQAPRPAFAALQMVAQHFAAVTSAEWVQTEYMNIVHMQRHDSQIITAAWARRDLAVTYQLSAAGSKAYLADSSGAMRRIEPQDGTYALQLSPARCTAGDGCFIGGDVQLVIQPAAAITLRQLEPVYTMVIDA